MVSRCVLIVCGSHVYDLKVKGSFPLSQLFFGELKRKFCRRLWKECSVIIAASRGTL